VLEAWDRQCAFCGYDGQVTGASVAIEAAHVRWFAFGGPDALDNSLALCALHHKLFDLGVLGLNPGRQVIVSSRFSAHTPAGRAVYDFDGHELTPRPGTALPAPVHVAWHTRQVFKGEPLAA
jgi:putative restriction endonuclease